MGFALMFVHKNFHLVPFEEIPLGRDLIFMDEKWIPAYEKKWLEVFSGNKDADTNVGYVGYFSAKSRGDKFLELSWYPNHYDRFHEVQVFFPKPAFVACTHIWYYQEKPRIFVKHEWLARIYERPLVTFALVDAIGVKRLLQAENIPVDSLRLFRGWVDEIAVRNPDLAFVSFADSLLVKQVWSVGHVDCDIKYTYSPEPLFSVIEELHFAFKETIGLTAYSILTQGVNVYEDNVALHTSASGNHVSLNTLGLPFAQLMAIENAARSAIREKVHGPAELYLDKRFFNSLKFKFAFQGQKNSVKTYPYPSPMTKTSGAYIASSIKEIKDKLK